ncbi:MAG: M15 family metallopeptidase [Clostridia bacterium]|nr:M15 family metallopeptidase [Clostridia bacterium]
MKQKLFILMVTLMLIFCNGSVLAQKNCSSWAEETILFAEKCSILTPENKWDYREPMKRGELVTLLLRTYENVTEEEIPVAQTGFFSDASKDATSVYLLGIMNGVGGGLFSPDTVVTREQISKIILTLQAVCEERELVLPEAYYNPLTDFMSVSDWAKPYVEQAYNKGIVTGYEDGSFRGDKTVSKEEAVALLVRCVSLREHTEKIPVSDTLFWDIKDAYEAGELTVNWNRIQGENEYRFTVYEQRNSRHEGDIPPNEPKNYTYTKENSHTLYLYPNRTYRLELCAGEQILTKEFYVPKLQLPDREELVLPETKEEADPLMAEVTVPVWRMKQDGTKYESQMAVTVQAKLADRIVKIFEEIYQGEERFPVKDLGGYAFRGGTSEHNWGTAVDLNANENYCIYKDGTTVGECWEPYENPFSVTPYGDVVNAFEKYGFTWGGDAWNSTKDYMHFSYLGT